MPSRLEPIIAASVQPDKASETTAPQPDPEVQRALEALGYAE